MRVANSKSLDDLVGCDTLYIPTRLRDDPQVYLKRSAANEVSYEARYDGLQFDPKRRVGLLESRSLPSNSPPHFQQWLSNHCCSSILEL